MTWSNLRFSVWRSFVTMATNLPSCFSIQFLEQLLKFLVNLTLLKYVMSDGSYGFLITKELIFGFQILDLKDHFSASLTFYNSAKPLETCKSVRTSAQKRIRFPLDAQVEMAFIKADSHVSGNRIRPKRNWTICY